MQKKGGGKELFIPSRQPYRHLNYQFASQMGNYYLSTYYMLGTELGHDGYNGEHMSLPLWSLQSTIQTFVLLRVAPAGIKPY